MTWEWVNYAAAGFVGAAFASTGFLFKESHYLQRWRDWTAFGHFDTMLTPHEKKAVMGYFKFESHTADWAGPLLGYGLLERWGAVSGGVHTFVRLTEMGERYAKYLKMKEAEIMRKSLSGLTIAFVLAFENREDVIPLSLWEELSEEVKQDLTQYNFVHGTTWSRPRSRILADGLYMLRYRENLDIEAELSDEHVVLMEKLKKYYD